MDKRLILNKRQAKVVDRIKEIFDELQKEGVMFGICFAKDHLEYDRLDFINAQDVIEFCGYYDLVDWDDPRRSCAYVDEDGRYIEPEDDLFNADEIYYSPREWDLDYIDIGDIYMDDNTIEVYFKD